MLPILRVLPVGGVFLAILILALALIPPDGPRAPLNTTMVPARSALVDVGHHPETRQFLIRAALKRADELNRLRELPDTPTRTKPAQAAPAADKPKIAALPSDRTEADPEETATPIEAPSVRIPVETGESSAPNLPVAPKETNAPAEKTEPAKKAEQARPAAQDIRRRAQRPRRAKAAAAQPQFNLFEVLFGGQQYPYTSQTNANQQTAQGQYQQAAQQPAYSAQPPQPQPPQAPKPPRQPPTQSYPLQAPTEPYPQLRQHSY